VLFIETGFGADQHGQNATKAAQRACRNAIEFNSIPSIAGLIPGGYADMVLRVTLAVPLGYALTLDLDKVRTVFPYGTCHFSVVEGGAAFSSGIALSALGDLNDDMIIVIAHVVVGEGAAAAAAGAGGVDAATLEERDVISYKLASRDAYDMLVDRVRERMNSSRQTWVAIAGPPGSGKSSLSSALTQRFKERNVSCALIPMDGYHIPKAMLDPAAAPRRGAPFTFDADRLCRDLRRIREEREGKVPGFDHAVGDPVEDQLEVKQTDRVVLVEGNYLLLEQEPWRELRSLFDDTWFMECEDEELRARVVQRNARAWGWDEDRTAARVDSNDMVNAQLVQGCRDRAELKLVSPRLLTQRSDKAAATEVTAVVGMERVLFVETGFGADQKGVDVTKAALRACRNAIEFNSVPCIREFGYDRMLVRVTVAVPERLLEEVDVEAIKQSFPHGRVEVQVKGGGGYFASGIRGEVGQRRVDTMLVAVAHVLVGLAS